MLPEGLVQLGASVAVPDRLRDAHRHLTGLVERHALDLDRERAIGVWPRQRGEAERVLVGAIHRVLVGVELGEQRQPWGRAEDLVELGGVGEERRIGGGGDHETRPRALSISGQR